MARYTSEREIQQKRWTMLLTNKLVTQDGLWRWEAKKCADLAWAVLDALGKGIASFTYRKKTTGEIRAARGTLKRGIETAFDLYQRKGRKKYRDNSNTDGDYTYWDLDKHDWRSFEAQNLISFEGLEMPQFDEPGEPIVVEPERPGVTD